MNGNKFATGQIPEKPVLEVIREGADFSSKVELKSLPNPAYDTEYHI